MDHSHVEIKIDERGVRALHSAVTMTLEKWSGQGELDQEQLFALKHSLQGCIFEFDLDRD